MDDASPLNAQVSDAVARAAAAFADGAKHARTSTEQLTTLVLGLAMQNAVAQRQQLYMLQNAVNTALVRAMIDSGPEATARWGEALQLVREAFSTASVDQTLARLKDLLDQLARATGSPDAGSEGAAGAAPK